MENREEVEDSDMQFELQSSLHEFFTNLLLNEHKSCIILMKMIV